MIIDKSSQTILATGERSIVENGFICNGVLYPTSICQVIDITVPDGISSGDSYIDGTFVKAMQAISDGQRADAIKRIDADVDDIYAAVLGNRSSEYALAESDANDYKGAGYIGSVPDSVADWAAVKNQTAQWAADDILATASAWRTAQLAIRANRLARKEGVRNAQTMDAMSLAIASWSGFVRSVKKQLGGA